MNYMILIVCFVVFNVLGQFFVHDFRVFEYCENAFLLTPSCFQRFNISTKQNFLSKKKSRSTPLRYGLGAKKPILTFFGT